MIGRRGEGDREMGMVRGFGRFIQTLEENKINTSNWAFWSPFEPPRLKRLSGGTGKRILVIFDLIPLKFPQHFPIGLKGKINLFKNKRAVNNFDVILTISNHAKKDIISYFSVPSEKVHVVHLPVARPFLLTPPQKSPKREYPYAIYVGDVNWNKNLPNLARAIKLGTIPCLFVGKVFAEYRTNKTDRSYRHPWMRAFVEFMQLAEGDTRFIFLGYVSDIELVDLYKNALCNILVSYDEGFGYSYIEAASQGTPSVLSDIDIFHETAAGTALFANPNSPEDISSKIASLLAKRQARDRLGERAKERVLQEYSLERFKNELAVILGTPSLSRGNPGSR